MSASDRSFRPTVGFQKSGPSSASHAVQWVVLNNLSMAPKRVALGELSVNRVANTELSNDTKLRVVSRRTRGKDTTQIAKSKKLLHRTVNRVIQKATTNLTTTNKPQSG